MTSTSKQRLLHKVVFQDKANRYCADCNIFLSEPHEIYASFLPLSFKIDQRWRHKNWIHTKHGRNFVELHEAFTPEGAVSSTTRSDVITKALTGFIASCRNDRVSLQSIAHGVLICKECAEIHSRLDSSVTMVKLTSDASCWSQEECLKMQKKGNAHGNKLLEQFMPDEWHKKKSEQFAKKLDREVFIRYKYEILDFLLPKERWGYHKFMKSNQTAKKKWRKYLAVKEDKDIDWAVYTLGYADYRLSRKNTTNKKLQVPPGVTQEAERFVLDARRKQIYLIASVIKIQSFIRMVLTKREILLVSCSRSVIDVMRRSVYIQSRNRSFLISISFRHKKLAVEKIQALFRGYHHKLLFLMARGLIINIQSFWRGCITRAQVHQAMKARSIVYRKQILYLWDISCTPLAYRTKFWLFITERRRATAFGALEKELIRLWTFLEFEFRNISSKLKACRTSVLSNINYEKFIQVESFINEPNYDFPIRYDHTREGHKLLLNYAKRLQLERVQIYEKLSRMEGVEHIYHIAGIAMGERYKKLKLAKSIWNSINHDKEDVMIISSEDSTSIFELLFPDIRSTSNPKPLMPSKKSLDRFGIDGAYEVPIPLSLEGTTMHFCYDINQQVINNLADISRCIVTGVRHLALTGTLSSERLGIKTRSQIKNHQFMTMDQSTYSLLHSFVNSGDTDM